YLSGAPSGTADSVYDGSLVADNDGSTQRLTVAPGLTGLCSNDAGQATAGVLAAIDACGADARIHETNGLTFTSAPVLEATEISGPVAIRLNAVPAPGDRYWTAPVHGRAPGR